MRLRDEFLSIACARAEDAAHRRCSSSCRACARAARGRRTGRTPSGCAAALDVADAAGGAAGAAGGRAAGRLAHQRGPAASCELEEVDLAAVVREVVERFEREAARAGCARAAWSCRRGRGGPLGPAAAGAGGDEPAVQRAQVRAAASPSSVAVERDGRAGVRLAVRDEGIGIAPEDLRAHLRALRARRVRAPLRRPRPGAVDRAPRWRRTAAPSRCRARRARAPPSP